MQNMTLYGNLAKDAVVRRTQSGLEVTGFDVAVNDRRTKKTYWYSVSYWGKSGANIAPYLKKGQSVVVAGEFTEEEYNGKSYKKIKAYDVTLASKKSTNEHPTAETAGDLKPTYLGTGDDAFDDTIPF